MPPKFRQLYKLYRCDIYIYMFFFLGGGVGENGFQTSKVILIHRPYEFLHQNHAFLLAPRQPKSKPLDFEDKKNPIESQNSPKNDVFQTLTPILSSSTFVKIGKVRNL